MTAFTSTPSGGSRFRGNLLAIRIPSGTTGYFYLYQNVGINRSLTLPYPNGANVSGYDSQAYIYQNTVDQVGDGLPTLAGAQDAIRSRFQRVPRE